jgi:hypothetical protein
VCTVPRGASRGTCTPAGSSTSPTDAGLDAAPDADASPGAPACAVFGQLCGASTPCCGTVTCVAGRCTGS